MKRLIVVGVGLVALVPVASAEAQAGATCFGRPATIQGTSASEDIWGTFRPDVIVAKAGDDTVHALDGTDLVCGNSGIDLLAGHGDDDFLDVGTGSSFGDHEELRGGSGDDELLAEDTNAAATGLGGSGDDIFRGNDLTNNSGGTAATTTFSVGAASISWPA